VPSNHYKAITSAASKIEYKIPKETLKGMKVKRILNRKT